MTDSDYGKAKVKYHNAQKHLEAVEKKHRKRISRIESLRVELNQTEHSLPSLAEKLEQAQDDVRAARLTYRTLRQERKVERPRAD